MNEITRQSLINIFAVGVRGLVPPPSGSEIAGQYVLCADAIWRPAGTLVDPLVTSVNGQVGAVVLTKHSIGLGAVDNTSDMDKPLSTAVGNALLGKASKVHTHDTSAIVSGVFPPARLAPGSALQVLRRNAANTALEFYTLLSPPINTRVVVADYTLDSAGQDGVIVANAAAPITVTLTAAAGALNRRVIVKNKGAAEVNLTGPVNEIFADEALTTAVLSVGDSFDMVSDGTNWLVV